MYGKDIAEARGEITSRIGSKVVEQALEGHFASQEFYLRSKSGWSPQNTVNETEVVDPDTDEAALDTLLQLLNLDDIPCECGKGTECTC